MEKKGFKELTKFVIPFILGNILQNMYVMADTAIVGKFLGDNALAAVGTSSSTFTYLTWMIAGFLSGFSIIAGQKFGQGNFKMLKRVYVNGFMLVGILSLIAGALMFIFSKQIMYAMKVPDSLIDCANEYIRIIYVGIPVTIFYNFFCEFLRAVGDSKRPFIALIFASVLNVIFDFLFICTFDMGVAGAAIATVLAQFVSVVICCIFIKKNEYYRDIEKNDIKFSRRIITDCTRIGVPTMTMYGVIVAGVFILQVGINKFGPEYIAAVTAASKLINFIAIPLHSYNTGISVFTAQSFGAKKYDEIKRNFRTTMGVLSIYITVMFVLSLFCSEKLVELFMSDTPLVVEQAARVIKVTTGGMYFLALVFLFKSMLNALGRPKIPFIQCIADFAIRAGVVILGTKYFGFTGIVLADILTWFLGTLVFAVLLIGEVKAIKKEYGFSPF